MFLTTKGRYAVMIMVELASAEGGKPMTSKQISNLLGLNSLYVDQILSKLRIKNIVKSVRGPGGGYSIIPDWSDINVLDIMNAADEKLKMTKCDGKEGSKCINISKSKCNTHHFWSEFEKEIEGFLSTKTLQYICRK